VDPEQLVGVGLELRVEARAAEQRRRGLRIAPVALSLRLSRSKALEHRRGTPAAAKDAPKHARKPNWMAISM
tara:strand:- start:79 stop:294 length:216 start_codon:yes stop_codon:yes gene_type:complete